MTRRIPFVLLFLVGLVAGRANAQETNQPRQPHPYDITPAAGPWAILIKSYSSPPVSKEELARTGGQARSQAYTLAYELVSELRRDYKLPAYFFDRSEETRNQERERLAAQRKQRWELYKNMGLKPEDIPEVAHVKKLQTIDDQYAVIVAANYPDMDTARRDLEHIRKLKAPSEKLLDKGGRLVPSKDNKATTEWTPLNPFETAFVVPNPTSPKAKDNHDAGEEEMAILRELNSNESYSLIHKCPGKWTLVVKVYRGTTIIVSRESEKSVLERAGLRSSRSGGDIMSACGKMAHQFADVLRNKQLSFDAYVLHLKNMSLVTVGSFSSERDPRLIEMMNTLSKLHLQVGTGPTETLVNPPQPFQVPK